MLSTPVRKQFLRFCNAELDPQAFDAWVCEVAGLEEEVGHGTYVDLISADYLGRDAGRMREVCGRLLEHHYPGSLERYRVVRALESMAHDDLALVQGVRELVRLYHAGCQLVPTQFVGFDSEMDSIPSPGAYHL